MVQKNSIQDSAFSILWIDLTSRSSHWDHRDEDFTRQYPGGGLLACRLLLEETLAGIDPLGPENLLIFSSSVIAGHHAAGLARFTASAKSPLTDGFGETRCEGPWGSALKASGAGAIVIRGKSELPVCVLIADGSVRFIPAENMWGETTGQVTDCLEAELGGGIHVAAIGPAGENLVRFASIVTDRTYQASRMGMGAVMGSKHLKALILSNSGLPAVADQSSLDEHTEYFSRSIGSNELTQWQIKPPGFSCWLYLHGLDAALCVNNYSCATFGDIENFKESEFLKRFIGNGSCPGCPCDCIKYLHPLASADDLDRRASGIHQEISGAMGPNLGIGDLDWILRANNIANQYGLDPTSLGFTISFAMELYERGILSAQEVSAPLRFGDSVAAEQLIFEIVNRKGIGEVLAEGTRRAAEHIGRGAIDYAMQVKGLEMTCFEPRSQTNLALGYAVAPIGPRYDICEHDWDFDTEVGWDHSLALSRTIGITSRIPMNYLGADKVSYFKALSTLWSAADALDFCIFAIAPTRIISLPQMASILRSVTGWETGDYEVMRIGERRMHLARWYNLREGLTSADDTLPERFFREPIADMAPGKAMHLTALPSTDV